MTRARFGFGFMVLSLLWGASRASAATPASDGEAETATLTERASEQEEPAPLQWSIGGAAGPLIGRLAPPYGDFTSLTWGVTSSTAWQIDIQRRRRDESFVAGVTLEGTHDTTATDHEAGVGQQLLGVDAFIGSSWRHRHWTSEGTIGVGVEAAEMEVDQPTSSDGNVVLAATYHLGLYFQGNLTVTVPLTEAFSATVGLKLHLTASHEENWYAASTIGVRYTLP